MQNKILAFLFLLLTFLICPAGLLCYADNTPLALPGTVTDAVYHPSDPVVYTVDQYSKKLYRINYDTNEIKEITLQDTPKALQYANNEIYVGCNDLTNKGVVNIYDAQTLALKDRITIGSSSLSDMVIGNDGFIYTSDMGSNSYIRSFSRTTKKQISKWSQYEGTLAVNPVSNSLYLFPIYSLSEGPCKINYSNGVITSVSDVNRSKSYPDASSLFGNSAIISPDGKYAFSDSGNVFTCSQTEANDRFFYFSFPRHEEVLYFDLPNNKFYKETEYHEIGSFNYDTFQGIDTYKTYGSVEYVFLKNATLIGISSYNNSYYLEKLDANAPTKTVSPTITQTSLTKTLNRIVSNIKTASFVAYHPNKPYMYVADDDNNAIYLIDTENATETKLLTSYTPTAIVYDKDELYVGYGRQGYIDILDATTLVSKDKIMTGSLFTDLAIGNDGLIYTSGNKFNTFARSFSRDISKPFVSQYPSDEGYLTMNPVSNSFYYTPSTYLDEMRKFTYAGSTVAEPYVVDETRYVHWRSTNRRSPDGKYIFNACGKILTCSDVKENDMRAYSDLGRPFYDLCFDDAHKSFYVSAFDFASTNQITQYDYNTWARVATYKTQGSAKYIHCQNDKILALSQDAGYYCVEIIDTNAPTNTFSTIPVTTALTKTDNQLHLNISSLAQTVYHPTKPYIYMTDTDDFSVHLVNKEKALETKLSTAYAPTSLAYYANELYIGYGAQGIIDIVDADTLALKEKIFAVDPFFSMVVGNDGFIYTNDESHLISISRTTKQVVYTGSDWNGYGYGYGHLESSAGSNALYFKDNSNSLFGFVYADGQIISSASIPISYNSGGLKDRNRISPDGRYVFNGSGEVFDTSNMQQGGIKRVEQSPIDSFDDLVFDLDHNRVMASNMTNTVYAYDYTTLEKTDFLRVKGNAVSMHMEKDAISVISQLDDEYMLASYDTSSFSPFESLGIQDPHGDGVALQSNGYLYLSPYVQYSDGTSISLTYNTAEYQSSDPDVVTVDAQGRLQAHAYGTATITISWGGQTKEIPVVVQPILTYVYLSSGTLTQSFNSAVKNYTITVPQNTTVPPTIFGSLPYDSQDHIDVLSAASLDDKTIVRVVSSDGTCFTDYTFDFELSAYIESDHPYHNNGNEQWTYTAENPLDTVHLTFSSDTFVERDYDYIYIKDANDADIAGSPFTGDELAGKTVHIPGGTAKITLTSDAWTTGYGFKITNITTSSISGGGGGGGGGSNGNTSTNRDFEAHSLSVTDDSQNPFSASSTEMSAITMIKNISDTTKHVSLYMTLLDADGKTLEVRCVKKDLLPNAAADVSGRVAIPADGKAASFRVFVWDDATQQPIVPSVEVHKETNQ